MLRREGDKIFKTGIEATQLLSSEAFRRDQVRERERDSVCVSVRERERECVGE